MLLWLGEYLQQFHSGFAVLNYLSLRAILATITALLIALLFGPYLIRKLQQKQIGQTIRDDGPQSHLSKAGTPTMGGVLILLSIAISTLLWGDLSNHYVWVMLAVTLAFASIGFIDDYRKVNLKSSRGLAGRWKFFWQSLFAIFAVACFYHGSYPSFGNQLWIPGVTVLSIGLWYPLLMFFTVVGTSNAVNLTDGLDGLVMFSMVLIMLVFVGLVLLSSHAHPISGLHVAYIPAAGELSVVGSTFVGAGLGFLWFNSYPADVFMGDVGALSLGAALACMALAIRQEILLLIMGGVFVAETLSVMIQVTCFKITGGKRIFKMSPLHHHFELQGWPEPKIVARFTLMTVFFIVVALSLLAH